jgi:hypothetical protein
LVSDCVPTPDFSSSQPGIGPPALRQPGEPVTPGSLERKR